jgi:hypothetical protein
MISAPHYSVGKSANGSLQRKTRIFIAVEVQPDEGKLYIQIVLRNLGRLCTAPRYLQVK